MKACAQKQTPVASDSAVAAWRFWVVAGGLIVLTCLLIGRLLSLQVLDLGDRDHAFLQQQGDARAVRTVSLPAYRGMITDRNGQPLAVSTPVKTLWAQPEILLAHPEHWAILAKTLGVPQDQFRKRLQSAKGGSFMYLRRHMTPADADRVLALDIPGVSEIAEYRRYYPAGEVAAHIVGFTNIDDKGQEGLELAYDAMLQGAPGAKRVVRNLNGQIISDAGLVRSARPGQDLRLSIDLRLQYLAYRELKAAVTKARAHSGSIILLDSRTGEILAMANQPSYNPNDRSAMSASALRNRAITDLLEPGSTAKPLAMVAALESGLYKPHTPIDTRPGYIGVRTGKTSTKIIKDHRNYGLTDITGVITHSSNVGMTKIAFSLEPDKIPNVLSRFGFGQPTGIGFPGEASRMLPSHRRWPEIDRATLAYGYGFAVTPLQLAQAYAVLANKGIRKPLSLRMGGADEAGEQVIDPVINAQIVEMMKTVTQSEGTATRASVVGYSVAGKTGTAHRLDGGAYAEKSYVSLFAGIAPASDPRLVAVVIIDDPKGKDYFGGLVAAPVFSKVVGGAFRLMDVPPDEDDVHRVVVRAPVLRPRA
jgi:cell division protein FtsI (penicillin-binding protein 3)